MIFMLGGNLAQTVPEGFAASRRKSGVLKPPKFKKSHDCNANALAPRHPRVRMMDNQKIGSVGPTIPA